MKLLYSKSFIAVILVIWLVFCMGLFLQIPLWIKILLFVPLMEFTFHEYIHAFVAWLHKAKVEFIIMNTSRLCCKLVPLPDNHPYKNKIYTRVILSGGLFQSAIYSVEVTILLLSFISLNNILPFMFAGLMIFRYCYYDIFPKNCDIRRIVEYSIRCGKSQPLLPQMYKYK